jgi:hypothetical protein
MNAKSMNGNGSRPLTMKTLASILTGNPIPLIKHWVAGKGGQSQPSTSLTPELSAHIQTTPTPQIDKGVEGKGGIWASHKETLERAERKGYEFGQASGCEFTEADDELLEQQGRTDTIVRPTYDPLQNPGDTEFAETLKKLKSDLAESEVRLPYVRDTLLTAENEATVPGAAGERPVAPQSYIACASLLIALLPFLTVRDLLASGVSDDPIFTNAVAAGAALVVGFVTTHGLFQAPPLKAAEGRLKAWILAGGLSLSLFVVRLAFTNNFLISLGFSAFEFCSILLVEHYAGRQRRSAYEWDEAHRRKQEKLDLVAVAKARLDEVKQTIQDLRSEIGHCTEELSLRDLQSRAPHEWEAKVIAAYRFGFHRAIKENRTREAAEKARQELELRIIKNR